MATTPNLGLGLLQAGQLQPEVTENGNMTILDSVIGSQAAFGYDPGTSSGLAYGYFGGPILFGGAPVVVAAGTITMTASATNYVERDPEGKTVATNITGWTPGWIPMAMVVTNASAINTITDMRPVYSTAQGNLALPVGCPTGVGVTTATTGGSIAASTTNEYQVTAVYPWGESTPCAVVSVTTGSTTATNENTITWTLPPVALSANVYGRVAGSIAKIVNVLAGTSTYTDTGSVAPSGAAPATAAMTFTDSMVNGRILTFSGVLTAAVAATFPATPQMWVLVNDTTGGYVLTVKTGSATNGGVTPQPAHPTAAYTDGTNIFILGAFTSELFNGPITQPPLAGVNNQTPLAQYGDLFQDGLVSFTAPATSSTLSSTLPACTAYVIGQRVVFAGEAFTVAASATSYLDLSNAGVLTVSTSATVTANSLRIWEIVSSSTAITSVTQVANSPATAFPPPFLEVNNTWSNVTLTVSTSASGGTIGASLTKYYLVVSVLADGSQFPFYQQINSVTTGTGTTNSNTISWSAQAGAVSYNVYEGPGNTTANLPSFGLIGNTTALSFTDTGITPGAQFPGTIGSAFTVIPFSNVAYDTASGWDVATNSYTIPKTGKWLVVASLRYEDDSTPGISYSLNADITVADSPSNGWFMTPTPASYQITRQGAANGRIAYFTKGEVISMFSYAGTPMNAQASSLTLAYYGE